MARKKSAGEKFKELLAKKVPADNSDILNFSLEEKKKIAERVKREAEKRLKIKVSRNKTRKST